MHLVSRTDQRVLVCGHRLTFVPANRFAPNIHTSTTSTIYVSWRPAPASSSSRYGRTPGNTSACEHGGRFPPHYSGVIPIWLDASAAHAKMFIAVSRAAIRPLRATVIGGPTLRNESLAAHPERDGPGREPGSELQSVFEHSPLPMLLVDRHGLVHRANPAACRLAGAPLQAVLSRRAGEILHCLGHLNDRGGCGFGSECGHCPLGRAIAATIDAGQPQEGIKATLNVLGPQGPPSSTCSSPLHR